MIKKINLLFVTFFGTGYIKIASGTFASLFTSVILFSLFRSSILNEYFLILCITTLFVFIYSLYAIKTLKNEFDEIDASEIVIDEVVGQWIVLIIIPHNIILYFFAFILFRFFDIVKPWPISWADKNIKGGWGIMIDDVLAAIFAGTILWLGQIAYENYT